MTGGMAERSIEIVKRNMGVGGDRSTVVMAKGLTTKDTESLNRMFGENLVFKPNQKEDAVEIRPTSSEDTAVHIAAELEDMGYLWKNSKNLGCRPTPSAAIIGRRIRA